MIGIFDSGSGGLTVLRALRAKAPQADVVYFGDLANAPYGNKSREELNGLTLYGLRSLSRLGATEIISACNSVSASIVLPMLDTLGIARKNLIEMVAPTALSFRGTDARVLVLATQATVDSAAYQNAFKALGVEAHALALPLLVSYIEEDAASDVVGGYIESCLSGIDLSRYSHVLLCCTHYPLVWNAFQNVLQKARTSAILVDPADAVSVRAVADFSTDGEGRVLVYTTSESAVFRRRVDAVMGGHPYTTELYKKDS